MNVDFVDCHWGGLQTQLKRGSHIRAAQSMCEEAAKDRHELHNFGKRNIFSHHTALHQLVAPPAVELQKHACMASRCAVGHHKCKRLDKNKHTNCEYYLQNAER